MSANLDHSMFATISRLSNILAYSYFMLYKSSWENDVFRYQYPASWENDVFRYQYPDILRDSECFQAEILSNCVNTFKVVSIH